MINFEMKNGIQDAWMQRIKNVSNQLAQQDRSENASEKLSTAALVLAMKAKQSQ